jgi:predicted lipid-binding transport protein (Tim44 family)
MDTIAIFDILLLAAIAGFILFRLWSVLGTRTGHERSPESEAAQGQARRPAAPAAANDGGAPAVRPAPVGYPTAAARGIADIEAADRNFSAEGFMGGAAAAHEMIIEGFAAGDRAALRPLLGDEVYAAFDAAIKAREASGLKAATVVVKQTQPQIVWAALKGRSAELGVRYESEIIQYSKNAAGETVEGSESFVRKIVDRWTWARDVKSSDPNWKLVDTDSGD